MTDTKPNKQQARLIALSKARNRVITAAKAWVVAQEDDHVTHEELAHAVLALREVEKTR